MKLKKNPQGKKEIKKTKKLVVEKAKPTKVNKVVAKTVKPIAKKISKPTAAPKSTPKSSNIAINKPTKVENR